MKLKHTKETIIRVEYYDLEEFASKIYGLQEYNFAAVEECGNDSSHSFDVDGNLDDYDVEEAEKIKNEHTVDSYQNYILLNLLCKEGHIEPGNYLINVSW